MRHLRLLRLAAAIAAALTLAAVPAVAGSCCVTVVYGVPPLVPLLPPPGYLLDPRDQAAPVYIVDQGPVLSGPGIYVHHIYVPPFARPTGWGDYAVVPGTWATPFPYVRHARRPAYPPFGIAPYGAYPYRPAYAR